MPINPATVAGVATGAKFLGDTLGGGGKTTAAVPGDLRGMRGEQIDLLRYLLGFGGSNPTAAGAGGGGRRPGGASWTHGLDLGGGSPIGTDPTSRLESFFGGLGVPQSDLQRNAGNAIAEFLKTNPEAKAYDFLNNALTNNPGEGVAKNLLPQFERNLSSANAVGPRFGTANAIAKTRAVDDYNLLAAQAQMQGVTQQLQASQILNQLGDSAFNRLTGAYGVGKDQAAQADQATQRRLQLLLQLLGTAQSSTLGLPIQSQPNFLQNLGNSGIDLATFLAAMQPAQVGDNKGRV